MLQKHFFHVLITRSKYMAFNISDRWKCIQFEHLVRHKFNRKSRIKSPDSPTPRRRRCDICLWPRLLGTRIVLETSRAMAIRISLWIAQRTFTCCDFRLFGTRIHNENELTLFRTYNLAGRQEIYFFPAGVLFDFFRKMSSPANVSQNANRHCPSQKI